MDTTTDDLLESAARQTGLTDFGPTSFREGLDVLVDSIRREARLNATGRVALPAQLTDMLANRLAIVDWRRRHPEIAREKVERPVFVFGMPRTGTTLVSYLLDCDPERRSLMRWEAGEPCPPPRAESFRDDPRIATAQLKSDLFDGLNAGFKAIHYEAVDGPTECVTLLAFDFKSLIFESELNIPSYGEWLLSSDLRSAYEFHRDTLQLLQWRAPGRWSLKTPQHALALDILAGMHPEAKFVVTHRDPVDVVASVCSLVASLSGTFCDEVDRAYIARRWTTILAESVRRMAEFRDRAGSDRFFDLPYRELVADPLAAMRRVYAFLGDDLDGPTEQRMIDYLASNPQGKYGRHVYTTARVGLDVTVVEECFADYRERFALPRRS